MNTPKLDILNFYNLHNSFSATSGKKEWMSAEQPFQIKSPIDNTLLAEINPANDEQYNSVIQSAVDASNLLKTIPSPKRGELVRLIGLNFRKHKESLAELITLEMGKTLTEARGEVQEVIDICDFAVGLSRQLYGNTMHSERNLHRMYDQYHPLGVVGIISAFNFPVAVWSWNAMIAFVCGNVSVWKPSELTPLSAIATHRIVTEVLNEENMPEGLFSVLIGGKNIGEKLTHDRNIDLVSATGSTQMGKHVAINVAARFGKSILELGGNNAIIVTENANLKLAVKASLFGVIGTAGQRCTSTRRLIVHENVYEQFKSMLIQKLPLIKIGNPLDTANHMGPLVNGEAVKKYQLAINQALEEKHFVLYGGNELKNTGENYVEPCLIEAKEQTKIILDETFAPIVYLIKYQGGVENAISLQNAVPQGLSSSIFTDNILEAEYFLSNRGSDCGIANVNIGTSGAEIGGAFGGEKETGGGRESGSDAWKAYMRRQTNTINYSNNIALAQGVTFDLD